MKLSRLLIPTDYSECSLLALQECVARGSEDPLTIHLLHVVDEDVVRSSMADFAPSSATFDESVLQFRLHHAAKEMEKLEEIRARYKGIEIVPRVQFGPPALTIVQQAEYLQVQAIAMSTHGRSGLSRLVMGSTTEGVIRTTTLPVLIFRYSAGAS